MTFSLVARCAHSGMFGIAISSSSPAVAARCSFAKAGVGAVASQNITDPALGVAALELLAQGLSSEGVIESLSQSANHLDYRQLLVVDKHGGSAIHSGTNVLGVWSEARDKDVASGGNLLANDTIPQSIVNAYNASQGHIGDRLIDALKAGLAAGGEAGPVHSAGLKIVDGVSWPVADLRCDWSEGCPIHELEGLWALYKPQLNDYVQRAIDPSAAPSYGVPGDD